MLLINAARARACRGWTRLVFLSSFYGILVQDLMVGYIAASLSVSAHTTTFSDSRLFRRA